MFPSSRRTQTLIGLSLAAVMAATRFHHFGDALHLPDASWAIFFLAGVYLSPAWMLGLMLEAFAIDSAAVGLMGISGYCLTPAYAGLQIAHLALWEGGRLAGRGLNADAAGALRLAGIALAATALAFVISNGAFYWFGGRVADTNGTQFVQTFVDYAPRFLISTLTYLGFAALVHAVVANLGRSRASRLASTR